MASFKGRIKEEDINAIRERTNIVEVVSDYVALKKKGKLFWGPCPFHQEKTPSFKVDPIAQLFHCFGCGEGGNVFSFIMKVEHLDFPEAVETLANRSGYTITYDAKRTREVSKKDRILEANRLAMLFYQYILLKTNQGAPGRSYLKQRGLNDDIVSRYGLGLAPKTWSSLINYLAKKGFSRDELVEAGLAVKGSKGYYDRFRDRLIFPIADLRGRVIAFGGRVLGTGEPKYLNSPETAVYHKSSTLYGLHLAKNEIVRKGSVLVVEGYTDVIALAQAGITNVVATLGTAFTMEHMELLKRFAERMVLVFDADTAGIKAAESASSYQSGFRLLRMEELRDLEQSTASSIDVRVIILPQQQDPAEFIQARGADDFLKLMDCAEPYFDFYLTREINKYNISEIRQKEQAAMAALKFIATFDPLRRGPYLGKIAELLGISKDAIEVRFRTIQRDNVLIKNEARATTLDPQEKTERLILHVALKYPEFRRKIPAEVDDSYFAYPAHARLFTVLKNMGEGTFDASVLDNLDKGLRQKAAELFFTESEYEEENLSKYFEEYLVYLKDFHYKRQISKIKGELESLQAHSNTEQYDALFEELIALEAKRRDLRQEGTVV